MRADLLFVFVVAMRAQGAALASATSSHGALRSVPWWNNPPPWWMPPPPEWGDTGAGDGEFMLPVGAGMGGGGSGGDGAGADVEGGTIDGSASGSGSAGSGSGSGSASASSSSSGSGSGSGSGSDATCKRANAPSAHTCISNGDPHPVTFDGAIHDFYQLGDFWFIQSCDKAFDVQVRLQQCNGKASCINAVAIRLGTTRIQYDHEKRVVVVGDTVVPFGASGKETTIFPPPQVSAYFRVWPCDLTVKLGSSQAKAGPGGVTVTMNGHVVTVRSQTGETIRMDSVWFVSLTVTAKDSLYKRAKGLCGNFNDDFQTPQGQDFMVTRKTNMPASILKGAPMITPPGNPAIQDWGASWRVAGDSLFSAVPGRACPRDLRQCNGKPVGRAQPSCEFPVCPDRCPKKPNAVAGTCSAQGDPHVVTFDSAVHDFYQKGEFWFIKGCDDDIGVQVRLVECNGGASCVAVVGIKLGGSLIIYEHLKRLVWMDGRSVAFGSKAGEIFNNNGVKVSMAGHEVSVVREDLTISMNSKWFVALTVTARQSLFERVAGGLCGNFNGKPEDDFKAPQGADMLATQQPHFPPSIRKGAPMVLPPGKVGVQHWGNTWKVAEPQSMVALATGQGMRFSDMGTSLLHTDRALERPFAVEQCSGKGLDPVLFDACVVDVGVENDTSYVDDFTAAQVQLEEAIGDAQLIATIEAAPLSPIPDVQLSTAFAEQACAGHGFSKVLYDFCVVDVAVLNDTTYVEDYVVAQAMHERATKEEKRLDELAHPPTPSPVLRRGGARAARGTESALEDSIKEVRSAIDSAKHLIVKQKEQRLLRRARSRRQTSFDTEQRREIIEADRALKLQTAHAQRSERVDTCLSVLQGGSGHLHATLQRLLNSVPLHATCTALMSFDFPALARHGRADEAALQPEAGQGPAFISAAKSSIAECLCGAGSVGSR